jgi:GNAT superfamily N-acetyltransferase
MNGFRVREARMAERFEIAVMWRELMTLHRALDSRFVIATDGEQKYARHVQEMIRSRDGRVLVAEALATGDLVGYLLGELQTRPPKAMPGVYGFISDLYVREAWRQKGVGGALFEDMRLWCKLRKATAIELYVAEDNPDALAFWKAMGLMPFLKLVHLDL